MAIVMGILNVTPDSFSDGGAHFGFGQAVSHGMLLWEEGAGIVDVGGESTRPDAERAGETVELARVELVIEALAAAGVVVSVDTQRAAVAQAAVAAGAAYVNDVSGGLTDPEMLPAVAAMGVRYVVQHWRGEGGRMQVQSHYADVVDEVRRELEGRVEACLAAGIAADRLILDPGLGFAKDVGQNWELLRGLDAILGLGFPVLIGPSRKRFLQAAAAGADIDAATAALAALLAQRGVWGVRAHAVAPVRAAIEIARRMR